MLTLPALTEAELNLILTALGQRPYIEVAKLIEKLAVAAQAQLNPQPVTISDPVA